MRRPHPSLHRSLFGSSLLSATDLNAGQLGDIASRLFEFAKENVGEELVAKILENVPSELRSLVA